MSTIDSENKRKPPSGGAALGWAQTRQESQGHEEGEAGTKAVGKAPTYKGSASETAKILALLKRPGGASLPQLQKTTGWQAHSVRGFLSGDSGANLRVSRTPLRPTESEH